MRKLRKITVLVSLLLGISFVCISCEKDEKGQRITYYKDKTGEGYVFYKFDNDSIVPANNSRVKITSCLQGSGYGLFYSRPNHTDVVYTDNNGKYSFKFLKTINGKKVLEYQINVTYSPDMPTRFYHSNTPKFDSDLLRNSNKIVIDTIFHFGEVKYPNI